MNDIHISFQEQPEIQVSFSDGTVKPEQTKTVTPTEETQTVTPDEGFTLAAVTVNGIQTQSKTVTPTDEQQTVTPDAGKYLTAVTVEAAPAPKTQEKSVTPSEQAQIVTPDDGKLLSAVNVGAIPGQYHDTSDADITAADVTIGKIAYGAGGQIVGTNDFVKPTKGIWFEDFDANGYPHTICFNGYGSALVYVFNMFGSIVNNIIAVNVKKIKIYDSENISLHRNSGITDIYVESATYNYKVGNSQWYNLTNLETVTFNCPFVQFTIGSASGSNVLRLYDFSGCTQIAQIYDANVISHAPNCVIRVPQSLLADWQNAAGWRDLNDVVWEGV